MAGIALGLVLVFAIIAVDLISKMGLFNFRKESVFTPSEFIEVLDDGENELGEVCRHIRQRDAGVDDR